MPKRPVPRPSSDEPDLGFWTLSVYIVAGLTVLRFAFLHASPLEFQGVEAESWVWSRTFALAYGTLPPLPVWLTAVSAAVCGPEEACARAFSPLFQAGTAILLGLCGVVLGSRRLGTWSMLTYATLPGVAIASMWISAEGPVSFFWAATLYAILRLRQGASGRWAVVGGLTAGIGALGSTAMLLFPLGILIHLLLSPEGRRRIPGTRLAVMAGLLLLALAVRLVWGWTHGGLFPATAGSDFRLLAFLVWQVVIFGPIPLYFLFRQALSWRSTGSGAGELGGDDRLLLLCLSLPVLLVFLLRSLSSPLEALAYDPGIGAVAYVAAAILVADGALRAGALGWLKGSAIAQGLVGLALYALIWATPHWPGAPRVMAQAVAPLTGWHALGRAVTIERVRSMPPPRLLIDGRVPSSMLIYYAEIPPGGLALWPAAAGAKNVPRLQRGDPGPFLLVTPSIPKSEIPSHFAEVQSMGNIVIPIFDGELRRFDLDRLAGYRGGQP